MDQSTVILFRVDKDVEEEYEIASTILPTYNYRVEIPETSLVIGRYSVLPYYKELEDELHLKNCSLINSYSEHRYIADILNWYTDVEEFTPKTYSQWGGLKEGKWVVKGKTNSRKHQWDTMMFAKGRENLLETIGRLYNDTMIKEQGLVVREYIPLKKVGEGINGLPITREWRCFFLGENLLTSGYYWASHPEFDQGALPSEGLEFAKMIAKIIAKKTNFFVLDVAEKEEGGWVLIEVNDGQQSGLSDCSPYDLYTMLKEARI